MTTLQAIGVFAGIPVLVLLVIALPLYGGSWFRRLTRRGTGPDRSHPG
ncbi:hypothetical protein [Pseudonocardia broussonetiae]|uniref:Uncharacterized protein n=1 Tax=Pseudonocardia broussonetiae TaxID=2736640 RepID=A0A6M6JL22_9PSEU|nr:hypothetical protein [Pseudonocardia broussonetiae]QJY47873.1 hypothetical protein HOP40_20395 [Pseudonocardia broussonetiae]